MGASCQAIVVCAVHTYYRSSSPKPEICTHYSSLDLT